MEGTVVPPLLIYIPVGVVLFVVLVFAFGFRSSSQPPSSMFVDENEKRNRRGKRVKKISASESKPSSSTNGHAKLLTDSPREDQRVHVLKVEEGQVRKETPTNSIKKDKPVIKNKASEGNAGKEQEAPKKVAAVTGEEGKKRKEKDEGDAWITVTATSRKEKKQTKLANGELLVKMANKSPKASPGGSGNDQKAPKKDAVAKETGGGKKEMSQKPKGSPKKIVENQIKVSSVHSTQSAPVSEIPPDQSKKRKKKGQSEQQGTANQIAEPAGLTNGIAGDSDLANQKKEAGADITPRKSRRSKKKTKTTQEDGPKQAPATEDMKQKSASPPSSPLNSPAKKSRNKTTDKTSPSKTKPAAKTEKAPAAKTEKAPASKTEKAPASKTEKAPASKTEKAPASKTEKAPASKTEKAPAAKTEKAPAAKTEKAPAVPTSKGSSSKKADGKAPSSSKNKKNEKEEASPTKAADAKPPKEKKSGQKATNSSPSSSEASPAKSKSSAEGSPVKSRKKGGGDKKTSKQVKQDDKQVQETQAPSSTSPAPDAKSKSKKKPKKESTPSTPEPISKQPSSPKSEMVPPTEPKTDSVNSKSSGKKNKRKGGSESNGKPSKAVNGEASHSLPPANAKEVPGAKTPDKTSDKVSLDPPTPKPNPVTVAEVPAVQENENWVEAKPKKIRKKVRRDL